MLLLALDTSNRQASVALCSGNELLGEYSWHVGNNHSVELLDRIQRLCAECGKTVQDVEGIAVATGPGSFNGVRVALATAKALAFSLNRPIVGVSTLDILAAQQFHWHGPVCAVMDAGRSELYVACYTFKREPGSSGELHYRLHQHGISQVLPATEVSDFVEEQMKATGNDEETAPAQPVLFCGELSDTARQTLHLQLQERAFFMNSSGAARHAGVLAMLALQCFQDGITNDPLLLEPLYIRRPSITTSTRKQPLLGGKAPRPAGQGKTEREEGALRH